MNLHYRTNIRRGLMRFSLLGILGSCLLASAASVTLAQVESATAPGNFASYISQGDKRFAEQDYKGAIAAYTQAIMLDSRVSDYAYYSRANAQRKLENFAAAVADYSLALQLNPAHIQAYFYRGQAYSALKNEAAAIADYNRAILLKPDEAKFYLSRAELLLPTNKAAALADLQKAAKLYKSQKRSNNYEKVMSQIRKLS